MAHGTHRAEVLRHSECGRQLTVARLPVAVRSNHRRSPRGRSVSRLTGPSGCIWCNRADTPYSLISVLFQPINNILLLRQISEPYFEPRQQPDVRRRRHHGGTRRRRPWEGGPTALARLVCWFHSRLALASSLSKPSPSPSLAFPPPGSRSSPRPGLSASTVRVRSPSPPNPSQAQAAKPASFSLGPVPSGPALSESYPLHSRAALV